MNSRQPPHTLEGEMEEKSTIEELKAENKLLRKLLWFRHGCDIAALYGDDGEMQCGQCGMDFKRLSATKIEYLLMDAGQKRLVDAITKTEQLQ